MRRLEDARIRSRQVNRARSVARIVARIPRCRCDLRSRTIRANRGALQHEHAPGIYLVRLCWVAKPWDRDGVLERWITRVANCVPVTVGLVRIKDVRTVVAAVRA